MKDGLIDTNSNVRKGAHIYIYARKIKRIISDAWMEFRIYTKAGWSDYQHKKNTFLQFRFVFLFSIIKKKKEIKLTNVPTYVNAIFKTMAKNIKWTTAIAIPTHLK